MVKQKISITDIAEKTGLSTTTVSRVLNGKAEQYRISKKSQQKIKEVAKELHYTPNQFAANLRTGKSGTMALIIPSLNNPFFAGIASEINTELRKSNYTTIISDSDENPETEKMELQQLIARNIEGLIIVPCGNEWEHIKSLQEQGLPVVCIDRYFENLDIPFVSTDNYTGASMATKQLIENGHSRITCIQGVQHSTPNKLRIKGFTDTMKKAGLESESIVGDDFTFQNGYLETKLLLQQKEHPTAVFTLSNTIAMGCMKALKEENIKVPDDISLITFDDHPYLDYLATPLSCIAQPVSDISKIAVKFLISKINKQEVKTSQVLLRPTIRMRDSIKRIN
ncbi:substrate-binding domain-containing protein [Maribellus comscasis]|uniref:Substrate-binding domain-containing protein n=1 Tax=Maribellus comscasis TaxID=2681766 RepID=A0A6I6JT79_9BACT|nr:LacI family DNA-binding transcriptional regulator [Maribellus comscasis]QGY44288.1 substrate-binding domain-containing protein [Maribellus comscasis]